MPYKEMKKKKAFSRDLRASAADRCSRAPEIQGETNDPATSM
jgi:hypothetical protein